MYLYYDATISAISMAYCSLYQFKFGFLYRITYLVETLAFAKVSCAYTSSSVMWSIFHQYVELDFTIFLRQGSCHVCASPDPKIIMLEWDAYIYISISLHTLPVMWNYITQLFVRLWKPRPASHKVWEDIGTYLNMWMEYIHTTCTWSDNEHSISMVNIDRENSFIT